MRFSRLPRALSIALLSCCFSLAANAQGTGMTHTVAAGETLYKIAPNYGVSVQQILDCNAGLSADVIRSGQTIRIPVPQVPQAHPVHPQQPAPKVVMKDYKVKRKDTPYALAKANGITVDELMEANPKLKADGYKLKKGTVIKIPTKVKQPAPKYVGLRSLRVAVVLPMLGSNVENVRSVEFYRGLLMGVEQLKERGISVAVHAYEEPAPDASVAQLMTQVAGMQPDLIVGPVYPSHFNDVAALTSANTGVVVPFSSKVPQVDYRPNLFVVNTPSAFETSLSVELLQQVFRKTDRFVFLHAANGNKAAFCQSLITRLTASGYDVTGLPAHITAKAMSDALKTKGKGHYVVITDDATAQNVAPLLSKMREVRISLPDSKFSLVGYDNWVSLSEGSLRQEFHQADVHLIASSYFYPYTTEAIQFRTAYKEWFHTDLLDYSPRMAPLGHDVAISLLGGMATYGHSFNTQTPDSGTLAALPKLQSDLRFIKATTNGGYVSRSLWMVQFRPDGSIVKLSAK